MKVPHLNRRLSLQALDRVSDGAGGYSESWVTLGLMWAQVTARTGAERAEAGTPVSRVSYRIVVRSAPAGSTMRPAPDQRLLDGNRIYVIRAVAENDHNGRFLTCFADEEVAA